MWPDCSSSKYASIDGVGFLLRCHTFRMAAITSFHPEKCYHLVSAHIASARCICMQQRPPVPDSWYIRTYWNRRILMQTHCWRRVKLIIRVDADYSMDMIHGRVISYIPGGRHNVTAIGASHLVCAVNKQRWCARINDKWRKNHTTHTRTVTEKWVHTREKREETANIQSANM